MAVLKEWLNLIFYQIIIKIQVKNHKATFLLRILTNGNFVIF